MIAAIVQQYNVIITDERIADVFRSHIRNGYQERARGLTARGELERGRLARCDDEDAPLYTFVVLGLCYRPDATSV